MQGIIEWIHIFAGLPIQIRVESKKKHQLHEHHIVQPPASINWILQYNNNSKKTSQ